MRSLSSPHTSRSLHGSLHGARSLHTTTSSASSLALVTLLAAAAACRTINIEPDGTSSGGAGPGGAGGQGAGANGGAGPGGAGPGGAGPGGAGGQGGESPCELGTSCAPVSSARRFSSAETQMGRAVAIDPAHDVVLAGSFRGAVDFGGGPLLGTGDNDVFIAKLSAFTSEHVWSRAYGSVDAGGNPNDVATGIATDADGNVFVTGHTRGEIDFGGGPRCASGGRQVFLLGLSPSGEHLFSRCFGSPASFTGTTPSVVVDHEGQVVLLGDADDDIDLGTGVLSYELGGAFVASFAPDGETNWAVKIGGPLAYAQATSIALDVDGLVVAGTFNGTFAIGSESFAQNAGTDVFVVGLNGVGSLRWARALRSPPSSSLGAVSLAPLGSGTVVTGDSFAHVDYGSQLVQLSGSTATFNADGGLGWTQAFAAPLGAGDAVGGAELERTLLAVRAPATPPDEAYQEITLAALDPQGSPLLTKSYGNGEVRGLAVRGEHLVMTGLASGAIDFGDGPLVGKGGDADVFVAQISPWQFAGE